MKIPSPRYILLLFILCIFQTIHADNNRKREFRGAWIQCVNGQFSGKTTADIQRTLVYQLDELQRDGVNAIIFQVRPECDALYQSDKEPWSRFLTGRQGKAPSPYWDPLLWMIEQCHKRGMELHAWINPYRAKTKGTQDLAANHIAIKHPERIFPYDGQFILNPGLPENRKYICDIVDDIVTRYDVDGIHIDDYFYPYPVAGIPIPDDNAYATYNNGIRDKNDWRRDNVNIFVKELGETIHHRKPWVKFGISPFGIYRNKINSPIGSDTRGTQNYDDLYADVLLWVNNGWVDYCVPQIYWQIGHPTADYKTLIEWWNKYASKRPLYIGEDVERTVKYADPDVANQNQMPAKYRLHAQMPYVKGTVLWYAKAVVDNIGNYGSVLRNSYWKHPALQPLMPFIDGKAPRKPRKMQPLRIDNDYILFWTKPKGNGWKDEAVRYAVYRFAKGEKIDLDDASHIVSVTPETMLKLPYTDGTKEYTYVVTSLDRMSNESKGAKKRIKL